MTLHLGPFEEAETAFEAARQAGFELPHCARPLKFHIDDDGLIYDDIPTVWMSGDNDNARMVVDIGMIRGTQQLVSGSCDLDEVAEAERQTIWPQTHSQSWVVWRKGIGLNVLAIHKDDAQKYADYEITLFMKMDAIGIGSAYQLRVKQPPSDIGFQKAFEMIALT